MEKDYSILSDEELVEEFILQKNQMLYEILYERYKIKVYHKCLSFSHDESIAQDLAHDVFLKVFIAIGRFRFSSKFSTWLYSITYNYCIDYAKNSRNEQENVSTYATNTEYFDTNDDDEADLFAIKASRLQLILEKLKSEEKAILLMKYQDELSIKEISEILTLGESAVKMRLARSRMKVLDFYENLYLTNEVKQLR